jgi:hypothetical protein
VRPAWGSHLQSTGFHIVIIAARTRPTFTFKSATASAYLRPPCAAVPNMQYAVYVRPSASPRLSKALLKLATNGSRHSTVIALHWSQEANTHSILMCSDKGGECATGSKRPK